MIVKKTVVVAARALVLACWSLQTGPVVYEFVGAIDYKVDEGFARKEQTGQCSMQLVKTDFASMAG